MLENFSLTRSVKRNSSLIRESWAVSWPMVLIMFTMFLIGLADVYVAGRFGKEIQAAYGFAYQIYFIFSIVAFALTVGSVSVISRLFTSPKQEAFRRAVGSSMLVSLVTGGAMSVLGFLLAAPLVYSVSIPEALKGPAGSLTRVYCAGLLFSYLLMNTNGILRGCKMIKASLLTMVLVCVLNVVLIVVLALHTPLGFSGIAYATVIATCVGCLINTGFVWKLAPGLFSFSREAAGEIIRIGWPAGLLQVFWQLAALALYLIIGALPSQNIEIMAAFTNGLRVESAIFLPAFAFNMAAAVVVGNLLGKNDDGQAFKAGIITAGIGVAIVGFLSLAVIVKAPFIAGALSSDPVVVRESVKYIYISFFCEPIMAWGVILGGGLNGAGDTRGMMAIVALSLWLVRIPASYFLGIYLGLGATAIWWAMNLSIIAQTIFITRRYFRRKWIAAAKNLVGGAAAVIIVLGVIVYFPSAALAGGYKSMSVEEFNSSLSGKHDFFLIDVHIPERRHIQGTDEFIPYNTIKEHPERLPGDKNKKIIVYCETGPMGEDAAEDLLSLGYTNVYNLRGGRSGWEYSGSKLLGPDRMVYLKAEAFKFTPEVIRARHNQRIRIIATSSDVPYGFKLSAYNLNEKIVPGRENFIEFTADQSGEFVFHCPAAYGPDSVRMKGKLIVD